MTMADKTVDKDDPTAALIRRMQGKSQQERDKVAMLLDRMIQNLMPSQPVPLKPTLH
jgi:hypothetical protein